MKGEKGIVACTFVENKLTAAPFFATQVTLGKEVRPPTHPPNPYIQYLVRTASFSSITSTTHPPIQTKQGVEKIHELGPMSPMEKEALDKAVPDLVAQAKKGVEFVKNAK